MSKGTVVIDANRCKGCELCTLVCPQTVLHMRRDRFNARGYHPVVLVDPERKCTGCAVCALMCPDVALTVYRFAAAHVPTHTPETIPVWDFSRR